MNIAQLLKVGLVVALLSIAGVVLLKHEDMAGEAAIAGAKGEERFTQSVSLIHYESPQAPVGTVLKVAMAFGYLLAGLAALLIGSRQRMQTLSVHKVRPVFVFGVCVLLLIAPYFPVDFSRMPLSVQLVFQAIETNGFFLFAWAVSMMLMTAVSGAYVLNLLINLFKEAK